MWFDYILVSRAIETLIKTVSTASSRVVGKNMNII